MYSSCGWRALKPLYQSVLQLQLRECIQTIFKGHQPLVLLLFLSLTIFPPMIAITITHASRVCCSVIPRSCCPPYSPCFSFSRSLPVSLSPSFCPLLCKQCNFSLQWENRYNRGSAPVCLIKEQRQRGEMSKKGSTLGAENK